MVHGVVALVDRHVRDPHEPWIMHRRGRVDLEERQGLGTGLGSNRVVRVINRSFVRPALRSAGLRDPELR